MRSVVSVVISAIIVSAVSVIIFVIVAIVVDGLNSSMCEGFDLVCDMGDMIGVLKLTIKKLGC